ncbi:hypothetical protein PHMEG_00025668 [Phytophthora megakarya]|uniref:Ubiquitin-like protease family profile domain-containing protein n=1 Tax=Phytophthora megakarya TaxID=4795 RepID=A0A225VCA8_9STRA|nr:hypothetical protein PHMEG_00025668 [Phytophthora megakarya]
MRRVYSRFSELLLVDCTHKTNRYNYQLLTFMAMNEFGEGTVVQHSLIEANGDWHMERAIAHFKRLHPSRINMLRVIMVDKDLNEIRVLESNFPDARVLICHFHVIKYLKEMRSKPEFCKISGDDASQIDAAVHKMVYAGSEDVYDAAYVALHGICDRIGFQDFFSYFERNWDTCQDRWVMYRRSNLPHFKNHTNNRLESFFGKLKDGVDSSMSMSACVKALVSHDKRVENEYKYRISRIGQFSNSSYDEEMSVVLRFTTHYVATQVEAEYCRALEKADVYHYDVDQNDTNVVTVSGKFTEHKLQALRTTQLIASEMADITDPEEFSEMVEFVLTQWRNVRQRKRTSQEEENLTQASGIKSPLKIRLNPKARKVGAPKKKKTKKVASERKDRKWFEAAEAGRKKAGEVSLQGLMDSLDHDQPSLTETQRRLSGVVVKYSDADKKKPKFKKLKNPVLILDPFYVLPSKLLNACLAALPVANSQETAISVDASQSQTTRDSREDPKIIEVIQIKDVGNFSRSQIELFKRVENLKTCVQLGFDMHKWLTQDGIPSLPAEYHGIGSKVAEDIQASYPRKRILGLPCDHDFEYAMLYRAIPPTWLTDASIRALCLRLVTDYPACRFAGFQSATSKAKRTRKDDDVVLDKHIRDRVIAQAAEPGVDTVLLPLNFSSAHWCCVVVKVSAKRIYYYDPLNQAPYRNAARAVATHLKIAGLNDFDAIVMNNPIQFDAYSCGVRFELFYYILTGHLLPFEGTHEAEDDETEEKMPAPVEVGGHKDPNEDNERKGADGGEDVPPTQVAE